MGGLGGLTSLTGGGGLDMGGGGPSSATGGSAGGSATGNSTFTFNNAGGTSGLSTQTLLVGGAILLGAIVLWKK